MRPQTFEEFKKAAQRHHGNKYRYFPNEWVNATTPTEIECPVHGVFTQLPYIHRGGFGCKRCANEARRKVVKHTKETFLKAARKVFGKELKYKHLPSTIRSGGKVTLVCPDHGEQRILVYRHLLGHSCPECSKEEGRKKRAAQLGRKFLTEARQVHGDKYTYPAPYERMNKPLVICCPKHGKWATTTPWNHLHHKAGCPTCAIERHPKTSKVRIGGKYFTIQSSAEHLVLDWLINEKGIKPTEIVTQFACPTINYVFEKPRTYRPDFFIEELNVLVEVKTLYTLGLNKGEVFGADSKNTLKKNQAKKLACNALGYNYALLLVDRKKVIQMPASWATMTQRQLRIRLST